MITKENIEKPLKELSTLYDMSDEKRGAYYSKLALLELCGWIEGSLDSIILNYAKPKILETKNKDFLADNIIEKTYGFKYKKHLKRMLIQIIGIVKVDELERQLKKMGHLDVLESKLNDLWELRRSAAHTNMEGTMITYQSPSVMITNLGLLYNKFLILEEELSKI